MDLASPSTNPTYSSPVTTSPTTTTTTTTTLATTTSPSSTPSRYENQKRRDLNTFCQYLRNHRPPLSLPMCSGAHVLEFLRYIDQFGKTKVHNQTCPFFGLPNPPAPCPCPLRQAWGTLDALIGRLRAAYEEQHGGRPEGNPFGAKAVRIYLREVRDFQAKARGLSYMKKRKGPKLQDDLKSGWTGPISASAQEQNNVDMAQQQEPLLTGIEPANDFTGAGIEPANDLTGAGIELPRDTPDDQDELKKLEGSKYRDMVDDFKSGWTLLMTNLILEMASAVFDQLGYALVGMVLAFVALLLSTADLIHMARKERMSLLPSSLCTSTATLAPGKPVGTIVEYFGLVGAVWQCFYSTVEYTYARQKRDNPIKMCLLPFIFLFCVVISKLIKKSYIDKSA